MMNGNEIERLDARVRYGIKTLTEANQVLGLMNGLLDAVTTKDQAGAMTIKTPEQIRNDLEAYLLKNKGVVDFDPNGVVLAKRLNTRSKTVEEIRVDPYDAGQVSGFRNNRNKIRFGLEEFAKARDQYEGSVDKSTQSQEQAITLISQILNGVYEPTVIQRGDANDTV